MNPLYTITKCEVRTQKIIEALYELKMKVKRTGPISAVVLQPKSWNRVRFLETLPN
jgi:hypothetical protein